MSNTDTFRLTTTTRGPHGGSLRHEDDTVYEVLVDLDDGREFSLGFLQNVRDYVSGEIVYWVLTDGEFNPIPGVSERQPSRRAALEASREFMRGLLS
tara:strand:+ start:329 stop:619 length:291 start_codon:yes stop_codon:yes gene_type:complete